MFYATAVVKLANDSTVEVRRSFRAPRALLWSALTEPALLQRWMLGPPGWTMPSCEMDVRPGGAWRCLWRSDADGKEFSLYGEYREVSAPKRLVHTEFFDAGTVGGDMGEGSLQTLELTETDGVTTLLQRMDFHTKKSRDAAIATGMTDGMEHSYASLDRLLQKEAA